MGDELIDLQFAVEVVVNQTGKLSATLDTTESTSLPDTTGDQLECYREEKRLAQALLSGGRFVNLRRVEIS